MKFRYLKGSEEDFNGADDSDLYLIEYNLNSRRPSGKFTTTSRGYEFFSSIFNDNKMAVIAQREPTPTEKLGHGLDCDECGTIKLNVTNNTDREVTASKRQEGDTVVIDMIVKDLKGNGGVTQNITAPIRIKENEIHKVKDNQSYILEMNEKEYFIPANPLSEGEGVRRFIAERKRRAEEAKTVNNTITTRGNQYGEFKSGGEIMQNLKTVMRETPSWNKLKPSQREALEMIQHKIGRILNGNPDYDDNWRDIAGYAQLILNNITGEGTK
jgi:hypothetical protein